jgi:hypothetical protein
MANNNIPSRVEEKIGDIVFLGNVARGTVPDEKFGIGYGGLPCPAFTGKHKKHYQYDRFDEVSVDLYENGAMLRKAGTGVYEWFGKTRIQDCFDKAKVLGARSKALNRMFR